MKTCKDSWSGCQGATRASQGVGHSLGSPGLTGQGLTSRGPFHCPQPGCRAGGGGSSQSPLPGKVVVMGLGQGQARKLSWQIKISSSNDSYSQTPGRGICLGPWQNQSLKLRCCLWGCLFCCICRMKLRSVAVLSLRTLWLAIVTNIGVIHVGEVLKNGNYWMQELFWGNNRRSTAYICS